MRTRIGITTALVLLAPALSLAWTGPSGNPPGNNVNLSGYLDTSANSQIKTGALSVTGFQNYGNMQSCATALCTVGGYLFFGSGTSDSAGYGIKDDAGILKFKNAGGVWAAFGTGSSQWTTSGSDISYTGGNVGIGTATPNANAVLDVTSTAKGVLLPRVALTSTTSAAPLGAHVAGMLVYNTATAGDVTPGLYVDNGTAWSPVAAPSCTHGSQTFSYTGAMQSFTVPANCISLTITTKGAQGGAGASGGIGGFGAIITGTFILTPGNVLTILVGGQPTGGSYAAGGGGTFVALGSSYLYATPLIVAGGGGGGYGTTGMSASASSGTGYGGSSAACGGGGGGFYTSGGADTWYGAGGGSGFRQGGAGGTFTAYAYQAGGYGGGAPADYVGTCNLEGGAGGGYGGGRGLDDGTLQGYGYGGSSYNGGTSQSNSVGNTGNGSVMITW